MLWYERNEHVQAFFFTLVKSLFQTPRKAAKYIYYK